MSYKKLSLKETIKTGREFSFGGQLDVLVDNFNNAGCDGTELEASISNLEDAKWDVELAALKSNLSMDNKFDEIGDWSKDKITYLIKEKIASLPEPNLTEQEKAARIIDFEESLDEGLFNLEEKKQLKMEISTLGL